MPSTEQAASPAAGDHLAQETTQELPGARFKDILEATSDFVGALDPQQHLIYLNAAGRRMVGLGLDEDLSSVSIANIHPAWAHQIIVNEGIPTAIREGIWSRETALLSRDGRQIPVSEVIVAHKRPDGSLEFLSKIVRDISESRRASDSSQRANAYNRSLIEASLDPLVTIGPDGKITDVNAATEQVTGRSRTELIGTDFCDYFTEPEKARAGYQQVFRDGQVQDYALNLRHRDGHVRSVLYNASLYRDEAGQVIGVFAAARDITERKRAEELIAQQTREILEIATPVVQVWDGVVAVPLIGSLDSERTQQLTERLLEHTMETGSSVALVDITGVPAIDTRTAQHLIETVSAVRLLGAQVILTGIRPAIAQTLVHLGINLSDVITRASLAAGLRVAMEMLNLEVVPKR
jgi:PAS domain S-box-containing protein